MVKEAIILSGGHGTRITPVTKNKLPKALVDIKGKPLLEWQLRWAQKYGVKHFILAVGFMAEQIQEYFGTTFESEYGSSDITYSLEKEKLGSGGAIRLASQYATESEVFIMNGDILTLLDGSDLERFHHEQKKLATMALVKLPSPYGVVDIEHNIITRFREKPLLNVYIHSGVDIFNHEVLQRFPKHGQMEHTIFVALAEEREFAAYRPPTDVYWVGVDTLKDYKTANETYPTI